MDWMVVCRRAGASRRAQRRLGPALLALVLGVGGVAVVQEAQAREWPGADPGAGTEGTGGPPPREGPRVQRAQAWLRLSGADRSRFFAALRTVEEQDARARLALLTEAERCLERAREIGAVQACQDQEHGRRRVLRHNHQAALAALMTRYGLPVPPPHPMGWKQRGAGARPGVEGGTQPPSSTSRPSEAPW